MTRLIDKELANEVAEITRGKTKEELIRLIEKQAVIIKQLRSSENEIATNLQPTCDQIVINSDGEPVDVSDNISRQAAIYTDGLDEEIRCEMCKNPMRTDRGCDGNCKYDEILYKKIIQILNKRITPLPSAQPEPLTDTEQRIFLAAMAREEKVCKEVDRNLVREAYEDSLMYVCKEIRRKVKGALWT